MADDLDIKRVQSLLVLLKEDENSFHTSLTNWSANLVKQIIGLKTNEYEIIRFKNDFLKCKTNEERVAFILKHENIKEKLYEIVDEKTYDTKSNAKDLQKAIKLREDGKKCLESQEWDNALWYYWRAIALSPFPGSQKHETDEMKIHLALCFYERAETLFQLKRYFDCLEDIENAVTFGLSLTSHPKLLLLKIKCSKFVGELQTMTQEAKQNLIDALEEYEAETNDAKLTEEIVDLIEEIKNPFGVRQQTEGKRKTFSGSLHNGDNKQLHSASESVELIISPEKGRHLIAKNDIPGGADLIVEKPYASVLCLLAYKDYCYNCFKELKQRGFPCETCDKVTFCGADCVKDASKYHKHECSFMNVLIDAEMYHLALRTLLVTGVPEAVNCLANTVEHSHAGDYSAVLALVEHSDNLPFLNSFCYTLVAIFYALVVRDKMKLFSSKDHNMLLKVASLLLCHIKQIIFNATNVSINEETELGPSIDGTKIGLGIYPTYSLANHSCDSNATAVFSGSTLFLKTRHNIKKGE
ncbi:SET and MYND domain-containing protein (SMYD)-like protein, partial [Leptotrombidium deliense]